MNSIWDPLSAAVLSILAIASIGMRGKVLGRLAAAEQLLRAERPAIDQSWSIGEWDWAIKKVLADTAPGQAVMAADGQRYTEQSTDAQR
ncbi:Uncharacterised protein [Mycobacteroides abscessus subsp. abscessus]|uniref:hypothetical protein n=1 Tax=Mycobacteroides abscessus TaxID=36809 RepID=UPI0009294767|nr:hypothetical protein [Mycobacteroides abscessus]SHS19605.1 Uncharacterised protein [Mycobacteroides abscessus subsp. abscessus]